MVLKAIVRQHPSDSITVDASTSMIDWAGGILGGLLGLLGGVWGTYCSVRSTNGARERAFVIRASMVCWLGVIAFGLGIWLIGSPYRYGVIGIYVVALLWGIRRWNEGQVAIRAAEANSASRERNAGAEDRSRATDGSE